MEHTPFTKSSAPDWQNRQQQNIALANQQQRAMSNATPINFGLAYGGERSSTIPRVIKCEGCGARHRETVACEYCVDGK